MWLAGALRDPYVGEGLAGEGEVAFHILADDRLLVVAGHVVPLDSCTYLLPSTDRAAAALTVPVKVVEDGHAGLGVPALLDLLPVVRLFPGRLEPAHHQYSLGKHCLSTPGPAYHSCSFVQSLLKYKLRFV